MRARITGVMALVVVIAAGAAFFVRPSGAPAQTPDLAPITENEIVNLWCPADSRQTCESATYQAFPDGSMRALFALDWPDGSETCPALQIPSNVGGYAYFITADGTHGPGPVAVARNYQPPAGFCEIFVHRTS